MMEVVIIVRKARLSVLLKMISEEGEEEEVGRERCHASQSPLPNSNAAISVQMMRSFGHDSVN